MLQRIFIVINLVGGGYCGDRAHELLTREGRSSSQTMAPLLSSARCLMGCRFLHRVLALKCDNGY